VIDLKKYNIDDPLKRIVEKDSGGQEMSPMESPDLTNAPEQPEHFDSYHNCLKQLGSKHAEISKRLSDFEKAVLYIKEKGLDKNLDVKDSINNFFTYLDVTVIPHNRLEEKTIFYLLNKKLDKEKGHDKNGSSGSAIDIVEDDHLKVIQLSSLSFNLLGLVSRLPDQNSRLIVLDIAIEQCLSLIELLRLNLYRENHIVFDIANEILSDEELSDAEQLIHQHE